MLLFLQENLRSALSQYVRHILICPHNIDIIEQNKELNENVLVFQQDGTSPHYTAFVRQKILDDYFRGFWIGQREPIEASKVSRPYNLK